MWADITVILINIENVNEALMELKDASLKAKNSGAKERGTEATTGAERENVLIMKLPYEFRSKILFRTLWITDRSVHLNHHLFVCDQCKQISY